MNELTGIFLTVFATLTQFLPQHVNSFSLENEQVEDTVIFSRVDVNSWSSHTTIEDMGVWKLSGGTLSLEGEDGTCATFDFSNTVITTNNTAPASIIYSFSNTVLRFSRAGDMTIVEQIENGTSKHRCNLKWK